MKKNKYLVEDFLANQFHKDTNHASLMFHMYKCRNFDNLETIRKDELEMSIALVLSSISLMAENKIIDLDEVLKYTLSTKSKRNNNLILFINSCKDVEIKKDES